MKMSEVGKKLGKHDNTIRNWADWYSEYLSPPPPKGEVRHFIDQDFRVLAFINELADKGLNRVAIEDTLKRRRDGGVPFPPVHPDLMAGDAQQAMLDSSTTALALQAANELIATKDARIAELEATEVELRHQIEQMESMTARDRAESQTQYQALLGKYMALQKEHSTEVAQLNRELGKLEGRLDQKNGTTK